MGTFEQVNENYCPTLHIRCLGWLLGMPGAAADDIIHMRYRLESDTMTNEELSDTMTQHMTETMMGDVRTLQFPSLSCNMNGDGGSGGDASKRGGNPCKHWGKAANGEWQPVGDSNPCDGTENPAS